MLLLELFSGTGSVRRAFERRGWAVHSLDVDPRAPDVTFRCDIEEWEPSDFTYDHVHASPPCVHYSRARTTAATPRDLEGSDRLAQRALDIIEFYRQKNPNLTWTLENPQSGLLPARAVVAGLPYADADYCCYDSDKGYRKRTRIWGNLIWEQQKCPGAGRCPAMEGTRHRSVAQRGGGWRLEELYAIPDALCDSLAEAASVRSNAVILGEG